MADRQEEPRLFDEPSPIQRDALEVAGRINSQLGLIKDRALKMSEMGQAVARRGEALGALESALERRSTLSEIHLHLEERESGTSRCIAIGTRDVPDLAETCRALMVILKGHLERALDEATQSARNLLL